MTVSHFCLRVCILDDNWEKFIIFYKEFNICIKNIIITKKLEYWYYIML